LRIFTSIGMIVQRKRSKKKPSRPLVNPFPGLTSGFQQAGPSDSQS
jgi:hypothetical protein